MTTHTMQGAECSSHFLQWGLDKGVLRHVWDLVSKGAGALNQPQFVAALYLMDAAKRGVAPPATLPPGPFPPVVVSVGPGEGGRLGGCSSCKHTAAGLPC